jgi:hypothetical protein
MGCADHGLNWFCHGLALSFPVLDMVSWDGHVLFWPWAGPTMRPVGHNLVCPWAGPATFWPAMVCAGHGLGRPWAASDIACPRPWARLSMDLSGHGQARPCASPALSCSGHGLGWIWAGLTMGWSWAKLAIGWNGQGHPMIWARPYMGWLG